MSTHPSRPAQFLDEAKSMACIHCGLCLSSCPTYLETGNENNSPRGRIHQMRALQDGRLELGDQAVRHIDTCLGCRACEAACPSGVQYGALLEQTREHIERRHARPLWQQFLRRIAIEQVFPFPERMELAMAPARTLRALGVEKWLPKFARDAMALLPERPSDTRSPEFTPAAGPGRKGRVAFVSGCVMSVLFGETNAASIRLLSQSGYEVVTPPGQGCCGALHAHSGRLETARELARKNIAAFELSGVEAIIINAAGCGSTLKEYGHLLEHDPAWRDRGRAFSSKVKDLSEWLAKTWTPPARTLTDDPRRVTYHDACHLAHAQRVTKPPRDLVKRLAGDRYVELPEADVCCGSAGTYNLTEPEMAERLQSRKVENIIKSGAQVVVTTNPGCMLQIQAGLKKRGLPPVEVVHLADYLARASDCHQ